MIQAESGPLIYCQFEHSYSSNGLKEREREGQIVRMFASRYRTYVVMCVRESVKDNFFFNVC